MVLMKKKYFFLIVSVLTTTFAYSQTNIYHPFPDSNAIWSVEYCPYGVPINECLFYQYTLKNDTIIDGRIYKIINVNGRGVLPFDTFYTYFNCNIGAINQDFVSHKIYFKSFNFSCFPVSFYVNPNDSLLYDFSLSIGDTLKQQCNLFYNHDTLFVQDIDSILIGNNYRKKFKLGVIGGSTTLAPDIIEGIGSTYGLLEPLDNQLMYSDYGYLNCFSINDTSLFPSYHPSGCLLINGIDEQKDVINKLNIFPNPTSYNLVIEAPLESTIEILNIEGQVIKRLQTKDTKTDIDRVGWSSYVVDISEFSSGVYIIKATTEKGIIAKKFIKE